jgi:hypothetical protein
MDNRVLHVLDHIRESGFDGIGGLLTAMMDSQDENIKRRLNRLADSQATERFIGVVLRRGKLPPTDDMMDILIAKVPCRSKGGYTRVYQ